MANRVSTHHSPLTIRYSPRYSSLSLLPGIRQSRLLRRYEKIFCADLKSCDQMALSGIFGGLIK
jgi:hypothetical protein